jgi:hypothetical protein
MIVRLNRIACGLAVAALLAAGNAGAEPVRGKTAAGIAYAMGGVTVSDLQDLERRKDDFSLWITTAAKKTGAYLADVQVRITGADGKLVFNAPIPGPWLFIDLPPGRYQIEAAHRGKQQTRSTQIHPKDRHQLLFYFDDPADVSPEWEKPFKDNPYAK